jgi:aryl-alcohol dehydrogenase-like predicted oxidoreductase
VARLRVIAAGKGIKPAKLAVAWVLAKNPSIVPVMGARTRSQLAETLGALEVRLTPDEIADLEAAVPADAVAGTRYDEHQMQVLDSER